MKKATGKTGGDSKGRRASLWAVSLIVSFQVLGWFLFSMATPGPVGAKTFIVNSTLDETDTTPGDGVCVSASGYCTLRAAIQETNALSGPDNIKLKPGIYMLTISGTGEDFAATGDLDITDDLAITGTGAKNTFINGGKLDRVFHIIMRTVTITDITIQNGLAKEEGGIDAFGGGIFNDGGTLVIIASTISNNFALASGSAYGGGIYNDGGSLTITKSPITNIKSTISNNVARGDSGGNGGGIYSDSTIVTIRGSILSDNIASGSNVGVGGGIFNLLSTVTMTGSTLSNNSARGDNWGYGGGIENAMSELTVTGSTLSNNVTSGRNVGAGGGISNEAGSTLVIIASTISNNIASGPASAYGGGIYSDSGMVTITRSILSNNFASGSGAGNGGGIYNQSGTLTVTGSTLSNNSASGSTVGYGGGIYNYSSTLTVQSASKIIRNFASDEGGGIYSDTPPTVTISPNSVVTKNIPNDKNF